MMNFADLARAGLNPVQREIVEHGLLTTGFNVVLQMPTGAGKTWLAEQAIGLALRSGQRAAYVTPLRALAHELVERCGLSPVWKTPS